MSIECFRLYKTGIVLCYNLTGSIRIILRKLFKHTPRIPHQLVIPVRGHEDGIGAEKHGRKYSYSITQHINFEILGMVSYQGTVLHWTEGCCKRHCGSRSKETPLDAALSFRICSIKHKAGCQQVALLKFESTA